ncbi:MAG: polyphosphate:AMP phosphotransferase [Clostridiales bacterium]|nr:polyphosphate:AMP phosphotransferase [Clostridiales bacterium]
MTTWDSVVDEIFFGGREKKAAEEAAKKAAIAGAAETADEALVVAPEAAPVVAAKPMSAWDRTVDEIFFGGREAKAMEAATAETVITAKVVETEAASESETFAPVQPEPTPQSESQPDAPKPMSAWDRAVDEIFFGGREAKAAEAALTRSVAAVDAVADSPATEAVSDEESAPAAEASVEDVSTEATEEASEPAFNFDAAEEKLMALQHQLQEMKIPLVIVLEGWQGAGKGTIAGELLEGLDPRGYKVCVPERFSKDEELYPPMHRYWVEMPRQGMITLFVGSWYHDLCAALVKDKHPKRNARKLEQISLMEQMLIRDGAVIEKFFLDIPQKVQKKRLKELDSKKATRGTLTKADWEQNRRYDRWQQVYQQVMDETNQPGAQWHLLNGEDKKAAKQAIYEIIMASMEQAIAQRKAGDRSWDTNELSDHDLIPTEAIPELELFETDLPLDREYKAAVKEAQKKLHKLQYELYRKGIPMVIAFEGWDAAGKGGSIRRLTSALDPRGFTVVPIASPTAEEKEHHHMWRFWKALPKNGDIRIFDRTWYGRAMVERLEGFCSEAQWKRCYEEFNLFEQDLHEADTILCKFWLHISPEEQLKRFNRRANNPEKQWKLSDEDWRNREKWDLYEEAINDMLKKTNTAYAPWTVVEADNKHYARIKVLNTVIAAIEKRLGEE